MWCSAAAVGDRDEPVRGSASIGVSIRRADCPPIAEDKVPGRQVVAERGGDAFDAGTALRQAVDRARVEQLHGSSIPWSGLRRYGLIMRRSADHSSSIAPPMVQAGPLRRLALARDGTHGPPSSVAGERPPRTAAAIRPTRSAPTMPSISTILPSRTVKPITANGRPRSVTTAPALHSQGWPNLCAGEGSGAGPAGDRSRAFEAEAGALC